MWDRHYSRDEDKKDGSSPGQVRFKSNRELSRAAEAIESPYDTDARYRSRYSTNWTGYMVHITETCEDDDVHLITHVETTEATVHESQKTESIHQFSKKLPFSDTFTHPILMPNSLDRSTTPN